MCRSRAGRSRLSHQITQARRDMPPRRMFFGNVLFDIALQAFERKHLVFKFDDTLLEKLKLFYNGILIHRRINRRKLRLNNNPRTLVNNLTLISGAIAKRGNGARKQRKVIGHAMFLPSRNTPSHNRFEALRPQTDFEQELYHHAQDWLREPRPARRSIPQSCAHI